jgi:hypothetical protein
MWVHRVISLSFYSKCGNLKICVQVMKNFKWRRHAKDKNQVISKLRRELFEETNSLRKENERMRIEFGWCVYECVCVCV